MQDEPLRKKTTVIYKQAKKCVGYGSSKAKESMQKLAAEPVVYNAASVISAEPVVNIQVPIESPVHKIAL